MSVYKARCVYHHSVNDAVERFISVRAVVFFHLDNRKKVNWGWRCRLEEGSGVKGWTCMVVAHNCSGSCRHCGPLWWVVVVAALGNGICGAHFRFLVRDCF